MKGKKSPLILKPGKPRFRCGLDQCSVTLKPQMSHIPLVAIAFTFKRRERSSKRLLPDFRCLVRNPILRRHMDRHPKEPKGSRDQARLVRVNDYLMHKRPNKAPEPTTFAVTSRAIE